MSHGYRSDRFKGKSKKKLAIAALIAAIVLLVGIIVVGVVVVAIVSALLGQTDGNIVKSIGTIFDSVWKYATDFVNALWKQIIANPLQFITGGGN